MRRGRSSSTSPRIESPAPTPVVRLLPCYYSSHFASASSSTHAYTHISCHSLTSLSTNSTQMFNMFFFLASKLDCMCSCRYHPLYQHGSPTPQPTRMARTHISSCPSPYALDALHTMPPPQLSITTTPKHLPTPTPTCHTYSTMHAMTFCVFSPVLTMCLLFHVWGLVFLLWAFLTNCALLVSFYVSIIILVVLQDTWVS